MTQTRWVLLKVEVDEEVQEVEEYIEKELAWLNDSFSSVEVLEIMNEYEENVMEEQE